VAGHCHLVKCYHQVPGHPLHLLQQQWTGSRREQQQQELASLGSRSRSSSKASQGSSGQQQQLCKGVWVM
jgi:hypothetical protein